MAGTGTAVIGLCSTSFYITSTNWNSGTLTTTGEEVYLTKQLPDFVADLQILIDVP